MKHSMALVLPLLALAGGCAPYKYHAAPISPPVLARNLESRNLDDPGLRAWMEQAAGFTPSSWPLSAWNQNELTLAAYYFNTDMDVARANAAASEAAIKTAAMKPNPSVGADAGYETAADSPYLLGFDFSLPIETAGRRGYRIAEAKHLSTASRIQVAETAWAVRSRVRASLVDMLFAKETVKLLREQESRQVKYLDLLETRLKAGEIPLPSVTTARIDLTNLHQLLRTAEGQVTIAHSALAAAVGIPDSGLAGKIIRWIGSNQPLVPSALPAPSMRAIAVENRLDVQRALARYEAAQSRLQLEVARQYPDINLGPGYAYEEGVHLISLRLGAILPLRNRNEGPIAEAEAQRKAAGAQLLATQSMVIAQTDKAMAQYAASYAVLEETRRATAQLQQQRGANYELLKSGEVDQLAAVSADIQVEVAERARLDALKQVQVALALLEDALQRPVGSETALALPKKAPR